MIFAVVTFRMQLLYTHTQEILYELFIFRSADDVVIGRSVLGNHQCLTINCGVYVWALTKNDTKHAYTFIATHRVNSKYNLVL